MPYETHCRCGCRSVIPGTSTWVPGHATRYRRQLIAEHLAGEGEATRELYRLGWTVTAPSPAPTAFGFEAEFFGMGQREAVQSLRSSGINAEDDGYHHETKPYWRVTEDGSVSGEGCELVSPILRITRKPDVDLGRLALTTLRRAGGQVDRSCGLHVHHNLRGKRVADVAEAAAHWAIFQPTINRILPPSRHHAEYATGMHDPDSWYNSIRNYGMTESALDALRPQYTRWGRYHAINMQAIGAHGTLEYRQHSGTLNPDKLEHWALFTRAMHDVRSKGLHYGTLMSLYGTESAVNSELGVGGLMDYLSLPRRTREFYLQRERDLNGGGDAEDVEAESDNSDSYSDYEDGDMNDDGEVWCDSCGEWHTDE